MPLTFNLDKGNWITRINSLVVKGIHINIIWCSKCPVLYILLKQFCLVVLQHSEVI